MHFLKTWLRPHFLNARGASFTPWVLQFTTLSRPVAHNALRHIDSGPSGNSYNFRGTTWRKTRKRSSRPEPICANASNSLSKKARHARNQACKMCKCYLEWADEKTHINQIYRCIFTQTRHHKKTQNQVRQRCKSAKAPKATNKQAQTTQQMRF